MTNDSRKLWDDVVRVTTSFNDDVIESLRIPLYVYLSGSDSAGWQSEAKDLVLATRWFIPLRGSRLPNAAMGRVLFCFAHNTASHMRNILPVVRETARRGFLGGIVTAGDYRNGLHEFARRFPIVSAEELANRHGIIDQAKGIRRVFRAYAKIAGILAELDPHLALRLQSNRSPILREIAASVQMARAFDELLRAWSPSCVVSTSDHWPLEFQLFRQAAHAGIPSVVIQHGTIGHHWWPFVADTYLLWGDFYRNQMENLGAPATRLRVCGMPASDDLFHQAKTIEDTENPRQPPVCLILSHTHGRGLEPEIFERFGRLLEKVVPTTPFVRWKVKLHPSENDSFYRKLGNDVYRRLEFHPSATSLEDTVRDADIATTVYSTSALEAMILQCPVVVVSVTPKVKEFAWWPVHGGGTYAGTSEEFRHQLEGLARPSAARTGLLESQRLFLDRSFANPGRAAQAVVDFLQEVVEGRSAQQKPVPVKAGSLA